MSEKLLMSYMEASNFNLSPLQAKQFLQFEDLLVEWNKHMNLTGITESAAIYERHFVDSLTCYLSDHIEDNMKIIDVGTGAGFPGIPMKIYKPSISMTLLDALNKRLNFLKEVASTLELDKVDFLHGRAEDYGQDPNYRQQYDIVVSRAVADLPVLLEYCSPFLKVNGYFIAQKGSKVFEEIEGAERALEALNLVVEQVLPIKTKSIQAHHLLIIKKVADTPSTYPRRAGKPVKKPL